MTVVAEPVVFERHVVPRDYAVHSLCIGGQGKIAKGRCFSQIHVGRARHEEANVY